MESFKIANDDVLQAPPTGQPALPTNMPAPGDKGKKPPLAAPEAIRGTISEQDALRAVEGTRISTLQPLTGPGGTAVNTGQSVAVGGMLDSKLAVELMDALLPSLLVMLMAAIGAKMKKTDLQLTEREKSTIAPVLQKCLDQLMINFNNPWAALGVTLTVIYGAKLAEKGFVQMLDAKAADKELKEMENAVQPELITAVKTTYAPVITMKESAKQVSDPYYTEALKAKDLSQVKWEPSNELIKAAVNKYKKGRKDAIVRLKLLYAAGRISETEKWVKR